MNAISTSHIFRPLTLFFGPICVVWHNLGPFGNTCYALGQAAGAAGTAGTAAAAASAAAGVD